MSRPSLSGPLVIGDYEFEVKLKARIPGHQYMHAMVSVKEAGPIAGPGLMDEHHRKLG
ncbi:MAG: methane monooxygenase/ammonia monooxygenase subunit B [Nitrosomonas sp.]